MRPAHDLLHLLARDHRRLDERCRALLAEPSRQTAKAIAGLATDVLAHEASEQLLLHPLVAARVPSGAPLARRRTDEEAAIERYLRSAIDEAPGGEPFSDRFRIFHGAFVEHADREELEVFPQLRHAVSRRELLDLARDHRTLAVRLPTRLRCLTGGVAATGSLERLTLGGVRRAAHEVLEEHDDRQELITLPDHEPTARPRATTRGASGLAGA